MAPHICAQLKAFKFGFSTNFLTFKINVISFGLDLTD